MTTMGCSGNPPICTPITSYYPEEWRVEVTDLKNGGWKGTVSVEPDVFDLCKVGTLWPECWGGKPK
ncbi:hypothetical protein [Mycobacterium avium]|uniref:hypothetical protein n=1 Tax=Mycobacterium avium TaxID=1764 RepID=UPI00191C7518|nr:hypothetical protein [Mycobacterium avium]